MKISKNCVNLVKQFEGYHKRLPNGDCTTYICPAGVLTIGYGETQGIKPGEVWTHAQAAAALKKSLDKFAEKVASQLTVEVNQNQFDALVSFAYNVGTGALGKSTLLRKLNAGDADGAAKEFAKWNKGGGKVLPGLVTRRAKEAELFLTPVEDEPAPTMPQAVDEPTVASSDGILSRQCFSQLNELADQGSRVAGWVRSIKRWFWGGTTGTAITVAAVDANRGTAGAFVDLVRDHPFITMGIFAVIVCALFYVALKTVEKFLVTAAKDGRYKPRGAK